MFTLENVETHNMTFQSIRARQDKPYLMDFLEIIRQTSMLDFPSTTVMGYQGYHADGDIDSPMPNDFVGAYHETRNPPPEVREFLGNAYENCGDYPNLVVWIYKASTLTVMHFVWSEG